MFTEKYYMGEYLDNMNLTFSLQGERAQASGAPTRKKGSARVVGAGRRPAAPLHEKRDAAGCQMSVQGRKSGCERVALFV